MDALMAEDAGTQDPRYKTGMVHMQAGAWQEAAGCFQEVAVAYPGSQAVQQALEDARFKERLDASTRIRAKRWIIPWRPLLIRALIVAGVVVAALLGVRLIIDRVGPIIATAQAAQQIARKEASCVDYLEAKDLDDAEACCMELQDSDAGNETAGQCLEQVEEERALLDLYQQGVAAQETGDYERALALFTQVQLLRTEYRDVSQRISEIRRLQYRDRLFAEAEQLFEAGLYEEALSRYTELKDRYANFQTNTVRDRLYTIRLHLGRELIERDPPASEWVSQAYDHFTQALVLRPTSTEASVEKELAMLFLEGQSRYQAGRLEGAIVALRATHDQRPNYLHGMVAAMLYDAYVRKGDQLRDSGDCGLAYEQYGLAASLPAGDTALAIARQSEIRYCLTPTPTPSLTPTPTRTPTPTPVPTITPRPSPVPPVPPTPVPPPIPLTALRGKIAFFSDNPEQAGYWAMEPTGENRRYLGEAHTDHFRELLAAYREGERLSPDGRHRAFVTKGTNKAAQIYIQDPPHEIYGQLPPRQLTTLTGLSYDPVWSPDGGRVAFVSQEMSSDDIWAIRSDGKNARVLTRNTWEWDKHPSWSPDSSRITFWSNRNLLKQIYVMDAEGRNVTNISRNEWDEYDPIWIK